MNGWVDPVDLFVLLCSVVFVVACVWTAVEVVYAAAVSLGKLWRRLHDLDDE